MRIIPLVENTTAVPDCQPVHGLSLWIETARHRLLMDAGPDGTILLSNARALHVDLRQADMLVLSHGHYDHADGIAAFAALNPQAPIYLRRTAGLPFFSGNAADGTLHAIGVRPEILALPQLRFQDGTAEIGEGLSLFGDITGREYWPQSNLRLSRKDGDGYHQDTFDHEQCLVIRENGKTVLLSGCAHNGILNILSRFRELYGGSPDAVISGFHMKKSSPYTPEEEETIRATARELVKWPCLFYTCHCTGETAFAMMKDIMGDQLRYAACGTIIDL